MKYGRLTVIDDTLYIGKSRFAKCIGEPFMEWAKSNGYDDSLTLDRIDPSKGYFPDNCQWITKADQQKYNKRNSRIENRNWERPVI